MYSHSWLIGLTFLVLLILFLILTIVVPSETRSRLLKWAKSLKWNRNPSPARTFRREQKRKRKLAAELEKVSMALGKEVGVIKRLGDMHVWLEGMTPDGLVSWLNIYGEYEYEAHHLNYSFLHRSPLLVWIRAWVKNNTFVSAEPLMLRPGKPGWTAEDAFALASKLQHEEWAELRERHLTKAKELREQAGELAIEIGVTSAAWSKMFESEPVSQQPVAETPREKLANVRVRIAELEKEGSALEEKIDDEEQKNASGAYRRSVV